MCERENTKKKGHSRQRRDGADSGAETKSDESFTVGEMEGSSLWLKSGARGGGESRGSKPDYEMICVVKGGRSL